jgi:hypothetical protein
MESGYIRLISDITLALGLVGRTEATDLSVRDPQPDWKSNGLPSDYKYRPSPLHFLIGLPWAGEE